MPTSTRAVGTSVFTIRCGKFVIAHRADRGVRPYRALCVCVDGVYRFAIAFCRVDVGIDPYGDFACRRTLCDFAFASCTGGASPAPTVRRAFRIFQIGAAAPPRRLLPTLLIIIPPLTRRGKTPPATFPAPAPPRPQGARPFAPARPRRCCRSGSRAAGRAWLRSAPPPMPCAG